MSDATCQQCLFPGLKGIHTCQASKPSPETCYACLRPGAGYLHVCGGQGKRAVKESPMTRAELLDLLMLLSAVESWSFSAGQRMPDYLHERLDELVKRLSEELLKEQA